MSNTGAVMMMCVMWMLRWSVWVKCMSEGGLYTSQAVKTYLQFHAPASACSWLVSVSGWSCACKNCVSGELCFCVYCSITKIRKDLYMNCRVSSSYFFLFFQQIPIFSLFFSKIPISSYFSSNLQLNFSFQVIFFQCGNTCTERAVLWENLSRGVVWVRFSHKSWTNVWRSVDLTSPHPG